MIVTMAEGGFEPQKSPLKTLKGASKATRLLTFIDSLIPLDGRHEKIYLIYKIQSFNKTLI